MAFESMPERSGLVRALFGALVLALLLLGYGLIRYRGILVFSRSGLLFAGVLLVLILLFAAYAYVGREISEGFGRDEMWAQRQGVRFGLLAGLCWIAEVISDNIIPDASRLIGLACAVAILILSLLAGLYGARHTHSFSFGCRIGLWSGLLGGLSAWIALLLLTYVLLERLQHYPQYVQGFAHSSDADITNYLVKNAIFVAAAHLLLAPLLGLAGGTLGAFINQTWTRRASATQVDEPSS